MASAFPPALVFFDLETTGLDEDCDIVQLAARCEDDRFNSYVLPRKQVSPTAAQVNRMYLGADGLYCDGRKTDAVDVADALARFYTFLARQPSTRVILVAHNCARFDYPHLRRHIVAQGLRHVFANVVVGYADTLPMLREHKYFQANTGYGLTPVAKQLGLDVRGSHDAAFDVDLLVDVCQRIPLPPEDILASARRCDLVK